MTVATGSQSDLGYIAESSYGVVPNTPSMKRIRHVKSSLGVQKETYTSDEKRSDRMTADVRHGIVKVSGDIETELSVSSFDDFIEALMGGTWVNGISKTESNYTELSAVASTKTFSVGSGHNLITDGFKIGDLIQISNTGVNDSKFTITALTATTFTVAETVVDMSNDTSFTIQVLGKKLVIGNTYRSFTIERAFRDVNKYLLNKGCRINSMQMNIPATGIAKATFGIIGQDQMPMADTSADVDGQYTPVANTSPLISVKGELREGNQLLATVTGMTLNVNNQLDGKATLGSNHIQNVLWGKMQKVSGELTVLFENATMYNKFINETESSVDLILEDGSNFMRMRLPRVKYTSGEIGDDDPQGLPIQMNFEALVPTSTTDDASAIVFQEYFV